MPQKQPTYTTHTLPDGTVLRFPADISPELRQRTIAKYEALHSGTPETGSPSAAARGLRDISPELVRYGAPIAASIATESPATLAAVGGLSEFAARELENYFTDENFTRLRRDTSAHIQSALGGAGAAALEYGTQRTLGPFATFLSRKAKKLLLWPTRKLLLPKEIPQEAKAAQRVLGSISTADEIYSLTLGQLNKESKNLITWLESTARSAIIGKGRMAKFDLRNRAALEAYIADFMNQYSRKLGPYDFGQLLQKLVNREVSFVYSTRAVLYNRARELADTAGIKVSFSDLGHFLQDRIQIDEYQKAWRAIDDLIPGDPTDPNTWLNIPPDIAIATRARLNELANSTHKKFQKRAYEQLLQRIRPEIDKAFSKAPEALDALKLADNYLAKSAERIDSKVLKTIRRRLASDNYPSTVLNMLTSKTNHIDNLLNIKKFFLSKSAEKTLATKGLIKSTGVGLEEYNRAILQPLRHSILSEAFDAESGNILGTKLAKVLDRYDPTYLTELFGPDGAKRLRDIATTLKLIEKTSFGDKVFVQLVQGGVLTSAAFSLATGRPIRGLGTGAAGILILPYALAIGLTQPKFVRILTDGLTAGPGTTKFSRMLSAVAAQNLAAKNYLEKLDPEAKEFYSFNNKLPLTYDYGTPAGEAWAD